MRSNFLTALDEEIQVTERKLDQLNNLRDEYMEMESQEHGGRFGSRGARSSGGMSGRGRYSSNRGVDYDDGGRSGRGDSNIPRNKDDSIDERTKEGRLAKDAEGYDDNQLQEFMNTAIRNRDGSIDLRTEEGRALRAAGWVDDDGFEFENDDNSGRSGKSGSRGRSSARR